MMDQENYVWITSGRLRNPHGSRDLSEASRSHNVRQSASHRHRRITRNLRTIRSDDLFQNHRPPAYIDHYGNVVPVMGVTPNIDSDGKESRLLPEDSFSKLPLRSQTSLHTQSEPGLDRNKHRVVAFSSGRPATSSDHCSDYSMPDIANSNQKTSQIVLRNYTSLSQRVESAFLSSDSRTKTSISRARSRGSVRQEDMLPGVHETENMNEDVDMSTPITLDLPTTRKTIIRSITAVYNTVRAKGFLEERLKTIYRQRRATSAVSRIQNWRYSTGRQPSSSATDRFQNSREGLTPRRLLAKFRQVGRLAIYFRRIMQDITSNTCSTRQRSATELQWMAVYSENHDESLAFNKHLYSRDRVSTHVPDWALSIFSLPPEERTEQHCRRLHALLRGLRSFDKFTEEMQMSLCRAFTLERVEEGRVVLKSGHVGINFYFIYSGSVFVNSEDVTVDDIRRTATISVREKCELLVVDKDIFASVCPKIFEKELQEKQNFISSLDLFSSSFWSPDALHSLCMNAQIQEYKINKVIVANSCIEDWIYACMVGKCRIIRCVSLDAPPNEGSDKRKQSDVVLSEEILQLLAAAADHHGSHTADEGDMKENLLTSLGLDYVQTSKKLYLDNTDARERKRAVLGLNETTTLTSLIKKEMESKKEVVFLDVGVIESGEIFDLPCLLENPESESASTLMLVSSGAKILRIKKAAFFDQATQAALDNTRTLASKQKNPSQQNILTSYKIQLKWDSFKSRLVQSIVKRPHYCQPVQNRKHSSKIKDNRKQKVTNDLDLDKHPLSSADKTDTVTETFTSDNQGEESNDKLSRSLTDLIGRRRKSNYYKELESVTRKETEIIRRKPSNARSELKISHFPNHSIQSKDSTRGVGLESQFEIRS
ncbi:cyclic nucleotide-binding domain-containing protein 2 [Biomphalaria pfeifferi]|uniref:Cyclic nucleotide-binding domain-containing protein 2 n=1 Tax=Biomphalaria pfeifferi TaxID=112525 RepID=A0AAD8BCI5_BIOPF|nr:cyclic nucleotide-binding domain-containing protein 2 [Biomphalaria pfeifferi]